MNRVVIVGASLAGLRAAEMLRRRGYEGALTMVGAEPHLPYDRPPLSKEVLRRERDPEGVVFRGAEYFRDLGIDLLAGHPATGLDLARREVLLNGRGLPFDGLILATGSVPRTLLGMDGLAGVHTLRSIDDAAAIRSAFDRGPRVVVVGAGFIGSEVAASARSIGLEVTVVEMLPVPLARVLGEAMGNVCAALHSDHGTTVRCGVGVEALDGDGVVERVRLTDGTGIEADLVVVGVGVRPATDWLAGSGLTLRDGVVCDEALCAGPPGVYAAGDLARWRDASTGLDMRVEHWTNAVEQGMHVARNLLAGQAAEPFSSVPYFWSDQYGLRIQLVGLPDPADEVVLCDGSVEDRKFVALYRRGDRVVGAFGIDSPKLVMQYRVLLGRGLSWEEGSAFARSGR